MFVTVGDGASARLWTDNWLLVEPLCAHAPALYKAISRAGKKRSVCDALVHNQWVRDITAAATTAVLCDYLRVWRLLRSVTLQPLVPDRFVWKWSSSGTYTASSTYRAFFAGSTKLLGASELWRARAPPRVKMFFWLALHRRLWTSERRKRHGLQDDDVCAMCDQAPETVAHLFVGCVFSREVWYKLLEPLGLSSLMPMDEPDLGQWWISQRGRLDRASRPLFDTLVLLIAWTVWKERNNRVFGRRASSVMQVV
jgi:hypothetical protein